MLDPWIIEEIRRREEERRDEACRVELPLEAPRWDDESRAEPEEVVERGVTVIDL